MSKYIVLKSFTDLQDKNYVYRAGEPYPREGYEPTKERIKELSTENNSRKEALIAASEKQTHFELEELSADAIREHTNAEIKERLDELEIEYKSNDSKDVLIERLLNKVGDE